MAKVRLEAELVDKVSGTAAKASAALDKLARAEAAAASAAARQAAKAESVKAKSEATAFKIAARQAEAADRANRREIIAGARAEARKDRQDKKAFDRWQLTAQRNAHKAQALIARDEAKRAAIIAKQREESSRLGVGGAAIATFAGALGAMAIAKMAELGVAAVKTGHDLAKTGEELAFAFDVQLQGKADPAKALAHSDALAKRFGLSVEETRKQYMMLIGTAGEWGGASAIDKTIRLGADLQAAGEGPDSLQKLAEILDSIAAKGELDARTLKALGEIGVTRQHVYAALAEKLGASSASEADLTAALANRKMDAATALPFVQDAILQGLGSTTAGEIAANKADHTIAGKEGRIKAIAQSDMLNGAGGAITKLNEAADVALASAEKGIVADAAGAMGKATAALADTWTDTVRILDSTQTWSDKLRDLSIRLLSPATFGVGSETLSANLKLDFGPSGSASGAQLDAGLAAGIDGGRLAPAAAARLGKRTTEAFDSTMQIHSPSRVMRKRGNYVGEGLALGLEDTSGLVTSAALGLADASQVEPANASGASGWLGSKSATAGGVGGAKVNLTVNVTLPSADNAEAMGRDIGRSIKREIDAYFNTLVSEVA
jgi:hypothetical protein